MDKLDQAIQTVGLWISISFTALIVGQMTWELIGEPHWLYQKIAYWLIYGSIGFGVIGIVFILGICGWVYSKAKAEGRLEDARRLLRETFEERATIPPDHKWIERIGSAAIVLSMIAAGHYELAIIAGIVRIIGGLLQYVAERYAYGSAK